MIFGFGRSRQKVEEQEEEEEENFVLFQGAWDGNNPDLSANPRLVQSGLVPTKELISDALAARADMIRIEPKGQAVASTVFIDGAPTAPSRMSAQQGLAVVQMIKLLAGMDIKVRDKAQTGGIKAEYLEKTYELRINTQPIGKGGERLILRAYDPEKNLEKPREVGFSEALIEKIRALGATRSGLVLAAGPPFSGLTTLKIALMRCTDAYQYSIYCLAHFGGRTLNYVKMFETLPGDDMTQTMRRAMREDADVLTIDPIDDPELAKQALEFSAEAAIIADMHARDAADGVAKLVQMTKNPQLVADQLKVVVSQMFIRKLCTKCRRAYRPNPSLLKKIGLPPETRVLYRPAIEGVAAREDEEDKENIEFCETCNGLGYFGKMALIEVLDITEKVKEIILAQGDAKAFRAAARAEKMQSFQSEGLRAVVEGNTSLEELQRAFKAGG